MLDSRASSRPDPYRHDAHLGAVRIGTRCFWVVAVRDGSHHAQPAMATVKGYRVVGHGWAETPDAANRSALTLLDDTGIPLHTDDCVALARQVHKLLALGDTRDHDHDHDHDHDQDGNLEPDGEAGPRRPSKPSAAKTSAFRAEPPAKAKPARPEVEAPPHYLYRWCEHRRSGERWEPVLVVKTTAKHVEVRVGDRAPVRIDRASLERDGGAWSRLNQESYFTEAAMPAEEARRRAVEATRRQPASADCRLLGLPGEFSAADVHAAFRRVARAAHPDTGGSDEAMRSLIRARDAALLLVNA